MKKLICLLCAASVFAMQMGAYAGDFTCYTVSKTSKDSAADFTAFLERCSLTERIALMQSLKGLKQKIGPDCYGKLAGLMERDKYTEDKSKVSATCPLLPKTYNEVLPETIADAIQKGHLPDDVASVANIKKKLVWRRYNKINYWLHGKTNLEYHKDYVIWAAKKCEIDDGVCRTLSTFDLEQEIYKKHFADLWDKLTEKQRMELLSKIEQTSGSVGNKVAIVGMSGAAAISALSVTAAFTGFSFFTSITTAMAVAAGWVGVTLPFAAFTTATTTASILTGPIGWCIGGAAAVGGGIAAGWPDKDLIISFAMTSNAIKAKWVKDRGL